MPGIGSELSKHGAVKPERTFKPGQSLGGLARPHQYIPALRIGVRIARVDLKRTVDLP